MTDSCEIHNSNIIKTALITGATSGIGLGIAKLFAQHGINLILCGRRHERLEELKEELSSRVCIHCLCFDVSHKEAVFEAIRSLPADFREIDILVNNAGNAHGLASVDEGSVADWDAMIDSNFKGLLYVSKAVIPGMVERKRGHVVNVSSIAGKEVYPNGNVYCASKHAVDALSRGMLLDLVKHKIRVTNISPGLVNTEFSNVRFKGDTSRARGVYRGMTPLSADDVADVVYFAVTRPAHVNISDVTLLPSAQASATQVVREDVH